MKSPTFVQLPNLNIQPTLICVLDQGNSPFYVKMFKYKFKLWDMQLLKQEVKFQGYASGYPNDKENLAWSCVYLYYLFILFFPSKTKQVLCKSWHSIMWATPTITRCSFFIHLCPSSALFIFFLFSQNKSLHTQRAAVAKSPHCFCSTVQQVFLLVNFHTKHDRKWYKKESSCSHATSDPKRSLVFAEYISLSLKPLTYWL